MSEIMAGWVESELYCGGDSTCSYGPGRWNHRRGGGFKTFPKVFHVTQPRQSGIGSYYDWYCPTCLEEKMKDPEFVALVIQAQPL